jgi:hypothetical protein
MPKTFWNKDETEQQFEQRETLQHNGRWSGGVYLPLDRDEPRERPSLVAQVIRAMAEIRSA